MGTYHYITTLVAFSGVVIKIVLLRWQEGEQFWGAWCGQTRVFAHPGRGVCYSCRSSCWFLLSISLFFVESCWLLSISSSFDFLKYFFSEGISTESGDDVSSMEVKNELKKLIDEEDKSKPLSDDKLEKALKAKGYNIARRTVAKYREQVDLPVARLRKEL